MAKWDKTKHRFGDTYDDAVKVKERIKQEYKARIEAYTLEAETYGKSIGIDNSGNGHNDDLDAFRHAYVSAKIAKEQGVKIALAGGIFHELKGQAQDVFSDDPNYDQPISESIMDEYNNGVGVELGHRARYQQWSDQQLADEVKQALDNGKLIRRPPDGPHFPPSYGTEEEKDSQSSVLDSIGQVAGQIGGAISTVGRVTFDMATSLGKETLEQLIRMALSGNAGGKDMMKRAVQLAMGNMLANLQAQMMAALLGGPAQQSDPHRTIFFPEGHDPRRPVEEAMNHPQNLNAFDALAEQLMDLFGVGEGGDPSQVMVEELLERIRNGSVKLPGDILLPDLSGKKDGPFITIFGVPVVVKYPEVVIEENPQPKPGMAHLPFYRNGEGKVVVKAHSRGGHAVKEYTRSAPDGDVSNSLGYKSSV